MKEILSVTELTLRIKFLLEANFEVFWVEGEVSNLRRPGSGHAYFTLKDETCQIRAVIFRTDLRSLSFELEDGMQVILRARLNVYEPRGEYQLIADAVEPKGLGALQKAFEQLKARLQEEGLFDAKHKKQIPAVPRNIGVVTSPTGAVIRDILNITGRRFPSVNILIVPVRVQGLDAPMEIVEAIENLNAWGKVDVIILARGGGSLEDLAPFNDERVARAVFRSRIPVISAVGHEIDFTIADLVADLRAPTPSAAAELAVPDRRELRESVGALYLRMCRVCRRDLEDRREKFSFLLERLRDPRRLIADMRLRIDDRSNQLATALANRLAAVKGRFSLLKNHLRLLSPAATIRERRFIVENFHKNMVAAWFLFRERVGKRLATDTAVLDSLSPLAVLGRGYGIVRRLPEGTILRETGSIAAGDDVMVKLYVGRFQARVVKIEER
ncbi:MAG TPA: exodeoxyribonuclease VII large subunit [Syntrophales bacterium]|nr:exodeoxyribonuclease VII large subunit [Syntrophobacterales bacterium]HRT28042.1 exodeoxyribonuclease VII large subunit [Syntrophales bacterium]HRT69735.1 exodeoxyribonuclease VII large subunit [Syntrophales bacterium]